MAQYMHNQSGSGIASILAWRALAIQINMQFSGAFSEVIPLPGDTIGFQQISVSRNSLGQFFQELISQAFDILVQKLVIRPTWWNEVNHQLSLTEASRFEDLRNRALDWNCLVPNPIYQRLRKWLYSKILHDTRLGPQWFIPGEAEGSIQLVQKQKAKYLKNLYDFQTLLLLLVYGTSGGPPRATEVPPILFSNTYQTTRTLFIDQRHHRILLRLRYSKTANRTNMEQQAIRLLPESVSLLVLAYIGIIQPFVRFLEVMDRNRHSRSHQLLFWHKDSLIGEQVLARKLKSMSHMHIGHRIGPQSWRHIMQGFIRYYMDMPREDANPTEDG
jgi:hypothetical protein